MPQARPIIFLAFANDRSDGIGYLRNLPDEARRIHAALEPARAAGLCEVVVRQNATLADILAVFQHADYRHRIALWHYAGHANGYQLLLEDDQGQRALADAGGLADFLAQQRGLELVFLNGCSTQPQVQGLLDAGISAVIATAQAIDDAVATRFAECFYQSLAGSATVRQAHNEAAATLRTMHGTEPRHFYLKSSTQENADERTTRQPQQSRLPWSLYTREGATITEQWSLPQAANDPLFGLPSLPTLDLPASPFRHLAWFRRADAPIFFGRGHQIRELYNRITDPTGAPIILFYGQSGVGKSSLLAAGLLPRLEAAHTVRYERRDRGQGVLGALTAALGLAAAQPTADQLCAAWLALEAEEQQPVVVLLDQVEEIYTRPNPASPDELSEFLAVLQILLGERHNRPQGKLVLAFRKEWLAEIEKHFAEAKLPRTLFFLERLDRNGIIEAIEGITYDQRLQAYYGLSVETGLAGEIADDLLVDRGATVAPTLQILLSKLWERARLRSYDAPCFDQELYHELRQQGLLLGDFLEQQLAQLQNTNDDALLTGLTLDFLAFHTTPLGTAEQRTLSELRETYRHQWELLADLLRVCEDLYLLTDGSGNQPAAEPVSRLSHDTLAPLVRARFDESDAPGQRARRILENRVVDWQDGNEGSPLDESDLATVEAGLAGMRGLTVDEERLLAASRAERLRKEAERQQIAKEKAAAQERELVLQRQSNRRLQMVIGTLLAILFAVTFSYSRIQYFRYRADALGRLIPIPALALQIEQFEVTNQRYRYCVRAGRCIEPPPNLSTFHASDSEQLPVTGIDAVDASQFCTWIGRSLPTFPDWRYVATNAGTQIWPWDDTDPTPRHANFSYGAAESAVVEVGSDFRSEGQSREGVYDLAGNVAEWTTTVPGGVDNDGSALVDVPAWDLTVAQLPDYLLVAGYSHLVGPLAPSIPYPTFSTTADQATGFRCVKKE